MEKELRGETNISSKTILYTKACARTLTHILVVRPVDSKVWIGVTEKCEDSNIWLVPEIRPLPGDGNWELPIPDTSLSTRETMLCSL